ncbi:MAG: hypothetical protein B7Z13_06565 [Caulobacterales bacterium 32-67-6]|nr:MAG: hypothetical protein B7Z13_06565 [Caulobacterales bacterium 32-67-6]
MTAGPPSGHDDREDRLLPWRRVKEIIGLSRAAAWRMQRRGEFPLPVPSGRVGWLEGELTAWKAARKAGGRVRPAPFAKPRAPTRTETVRPSKPVVTDSEVLAQASLPLQQEAPQPVRKARRRARPPSPDQIDFGF